MSEKQMDRISLLRDIRSRKPEASFDQIVPECKPESHGSLVELACIDLIDRLRSGSGARVEEYVAAVPELAGDNDILDLIDAEICVRQELGWPAERDELVGRFPSLASAIDRMFVLDDIENHLKTPPRRTRERLPDLEGFRLTHRLISDHQSSIFRAHAADETIRLVRVFQDGSRDDPILVSGLKTASRFEHPSVLSMDPIGADGERVYYAMPFVDGTPLRNLIPRPIDPKKAGAWLKSLAAAIACAESESIPIGSISAEHILIDHGDQVRILGCGDPGAGGGVRPFGELLFEVLTGRIWTDEAASENLEGRVPDTNLEQICIRCLGLGRGPRYGGMNEVLDALTDFTCGRTITVTETERGFFAKLFRKK